jgi:hypothetical protein
MPSAPSFTLLQKGSNVPDRVPLATDLKYRELAVNYYNGTLFTLKSDDSVVKFINYSEHPYVLLSSLSSIAPQYGNNSVNAQNSSIVGGTNNTINHSNTFVLGTSISSVSANYTYVNNLSCTGKVEPQELIIRSDDGTRWKIVVSNSGVISAVDTNQLITLYWYAAVDTNWFNISNWFNDSEHSSPAYRLPTSTDGVYVIGNQKPVGDLDANWNLWTNPGFINVGTLGLELSGTNKIISTKIRGTAPISFYGSITVTNA